MTWTSSEIPQEAGLKACREVMVEYRTLSELGTNSRNEFLHFRLDVEKVLKEMGDVPEDQVKSESFMAEMGRRFIYSGLWPVDSYFRVSVKGNHHAGVYLRTVCDYYQVVWNRVRGYQGRDRKMVFARKMVIWFLANEVGMSVAEISKMVHRSKAWVSRVLDSRMDRAFRAQYQAILNRVAHQRPADGARGDSCYVG